MRSTLLVIAFALCSTAGLAAAQDRDAPRETECRAVGEGHIECSVTTVPGRVQRPGAFYVLNRSRNLYEPPDSRRDLVRGVRRAVRRRPF